MVIPVSRMVPLGLGVVTNQSNKALCIKIYNLSYIPKN